MSDRTSIKLSAIFALILIAIFVPFFFDVYIDPTVISLIKGVMQSLVDGGLKVIK